MSHEVTGATQMVSQAASRLGSRAHLASMRLHNRFNKRRDVSGVERIKDNSRRWEHFQQGLLELLNAGSAVGRYNKGYTSLYGELANSAIWIRGEEGAKDYSQEGELISGQYVNYRGIGYLLRFVIRLNAEPNEWTSPQSYNTPFEGGSSDFPYRDPITYIGNSMQIEWTEGATPVLWPFGTVTRVAGRDVELAYISSEVPLPPLGSMVTVRPPDRDYSTYATVRFDELLEFKRDGNVITPDDEDRHRIQFTTNHNLCTGTYVTVAWRYGMRRRMKVHPTTDSKILVLEKDEGEGDPFPDISKAVRVYHRPSFGDIEAVIGRMIFRRLFYTIPRVSSKTETTIKYRTDENTIYIPRLSVTIDRDTVVNIEKNFYVDVEWGSDKRRRMVRVDAVVDRIYDNSGNVLFTGTFLKLGGGIVIDDDFPTGGTVSISASQLPYTVVSNKTYQRTVICRLQLNTEDPADYSDSGAPDAVDRTFIAVTTGIAFDDKPFRIAAGTVGEPTEEEIGLYGFSICAIDFFSSQLGYEQVMKGFIADLAWGPSWPLSNWPGLSTPGHGQFFRKRSTVLAVRSSPAGGLRVIVGEGSGSAFPEVGTNIGFYLIYGEWYNGDFEPNDSDATYEDYRSAFGFLHNFDSTFTSGHLVFPLRRMFPLTIVKDQIDLINANWDNPSKTLIQEGQNLLFYANSTMNTGGMTSWQNSAGWGGMPEYIPPLGDGYRYMRFHASASGVGSVEFSPQDSLHDPQIVSISKATTSERSYGVLNTWDYIEGDFVLSDPRIFGGYISSNQGGGGSNINTTEATPWEYDEFDLELVSSLSPTEIGWFQYDVHPFMSDYVGWGPNIKHTKAVIYLAANPTHPYLEFGGRRSINKQHKIFVKFGFGE